MPSVLAKSLPGACAVALLLAAPAFAQVATQPAEPTTGQPAAEQPAAAAAEQPAAEQPATGQPAAEQPAPAAAEQPATEQPAATAAGQPADTAPTAELSVDTVVASVAGTDITLGELIAARRSLPEEFQQLPDEVLMDALIEQLANQVLLETAAREAGLDQSPAVRLSLRNQERAVLASAYMEQAILERVTDEAVAAAYEARFADAEPVEEAHAAHILVPDEATAQTLKEKLDGGADFAALAAEHGTDGTASRGGDLGWFVHGQMVPPFADAVFAMEPGTLSDPVETPFGWHVIKLFEKRPQAVPPLEAVRGEIVEELAQEAQSEVLTGVRSAAQIERSATGVPPEAIRADALVTE